MPPSSHHTVSVIIPVYNGAAFVREAVQSVVQQTRPPEEILLVNDGSTDESAQVLQEIAAQNPSVRVIEQQNQGQAAATNTGAAQAKGTLLALLDQDDRWLPEKLAKQIPLFDQPNVVLTYTNAHIVHEGTGRTGRTAFDRTPPIRGRALPQLLFGNCITNASVVVRTETFRTAGGLSTDPRFHRIQDYELWLRLARQDEFDFVAEPLVEHVRRRGSWSQAKVKLARATFNLLASVPRDSAQGVTFWNKSRALARPVRDMIVAGLRIDRLFGRI
jgi:glycosyltransferase involved in cell wall biosynthesis